MTLKDYITAEFGIVPDEVQLQKIRLISFIELDKEFDLNNVKAEPLSKQKEQFVDLPHMGFSLIKTK